MNLALIRLPLMSENDRASFECQASANPRPGLSWHRLDETPLPKARSTVSSNNTLTISILRTHDAGSYVCEAENVFGVTRAYATLAVQGMSAHIDITFVINSYINLKSKCL